jgi:acyl-CoA synthetase (AMP-forming)/AMP-acid ligase II
VEPRPFQSRWAGLLATRADEAAIFSDTGIVLRTFGQIELERQNWRDRLNASPSGATVIGQLGNDPGWPALFMACLDLDLVLTPVEPDISSPQLQNVLRVTQPQALIRGPSVERLDTAQIGWEDPRPDLLKITSGTTGLPRAIRVREQHLFADCRSICASMGIDPQDINFGVIPFSHSYGFSNLITPLIYQGTCLVCSTDRVPRAVQQHMETCGATVFPGTPALFQALGSLTDARSLGKVRLCISAGASLPAEVARQFHSRFGLRIHSFYGSSECGGICYDREGRIDQPTGFVGTQMDGVRITALDDNRIVVRGANVSDGYFPTPDSDALDGERFIPGDLVRFAAEGLVIYGRSSDFINIAGKKVHPSVVEEFLRQCPGVIDVIVFGIPSPARNEDLVAYVSGDASLSRQTLQLHCQRGLSNWQVPRDFCIVHQLPVNDRGKINRAELAREYLERQARRSEK